MLDVANPANPIEWDLYDTRGSALALTLAGGPSLVTDGDELLVLRQSLARDRRGGHPTEPWAQNVTEAVAWTRIWSMKLCPTSIWTWMSGARKKRPAPAPLWTRTFSSIVPTS